jgi:membrane-bound lytic murein transglycosylase D
MTHNTLNRLILLILFNTITGYSQFEIDENKYNIYAVNKPDKLNFSGENVPIKHWDIYERFDKEILINTYWQSKTIMLIKRAKKFFPVIEKILQENNIPDDFKFLALAESGLENVTSSSGAKGFWQFLKETGKEYKLEINEDVDERLHLEKSTEAACKYIRKAYDKLGTWTLAAAAYNMGITGIENQITKQYSLNYYDLMLNNETYRYVFRILALKEIVNNHEKYGFVINVNDYYTNPSFYQLDIDSTITNVSKFAINVGVNYKIIKQFNPWILNNKLSNENNKTYYLKVPFKQHIQFNEVDTIYHKAKLNETLYDIALTYNTTYDNLLSWNKIIASKKIKKNQKIIILKRNGN